MITLKRVKTSIVYRGEGVLGNQDNFMYGHHITYSKSKDQPGKKVANPARGQLNKEN